VEDDKGNEVSDCQRKIKELGLFSLLKKRLKEDNYSKDTYNCNCQTLGSSKL